MGELSIPPEPERRATRELAAAIVASVEEATAMPHGIDDEHVGRYRVFSADDVEAKLLRFAQEITMQAAELVARDSIAFKGCACGCGQTDLHLIAGDSITLHASEQRRAFTGVMIAVSKEESGRLAIRSRWVVDEAEPTGKRRCPACKRMTRITTAGCDHCDLEDK